MVVLKDRGGGEITTTLSAYTAAVGIAYRLEALPHHQGDGCPSGMIFILRREQAFFSFTNEIAVC